MTMRLEDLGDVLTISEVAEVLRIGRNTAYEAVRTGDIPSIRLGRRLLVPNIGLQRMLATPSDNPPGIQFESTPLKAESDPT